MVATYLASNSQVQVGRAPSQPLLVHVELAPIGMSINPSSLQVYVATLPTLKASVYCVFPLVTSRLPQPEAEQSVNGEAEQSVNGMTTIP